MLIRSEPFSYRGVVFLAYTAERAGDELALHDHLYNHLTHVLAGEIEIFDGSGKTKRRKVGDKPTEFAAGQEHGIRALTDGAVFQNVSPEAAFNTEQAVL